MSRYTVFAYVTILLMAVCLVGLLFAALDSQPSHMSYYDFQHIW